MTVKRPMGARNETVECEHCGERYATTYKRCPFCGGKPIPRRDPGEDEPTLIFRRPTRHEIEDAAAKARRRPPAEEASEAYEDEPMRRFMPQRPEVEAPEDDYDDGYEDDEDDQPRRPAGRRLVGGPEENVSRRRGPALRSIIGGVLSLALIVAAGYIVFSIVNSLLDQAPAPSSPPVISSPAPSGTATPEPTLLPPDASSTPQPTAPATIPPGQTATGFTLTNDAGTRKQDITLSPEFPNFIFKVAFSPTGTTGSITWTSSKPEIVSVDQTGKVEGLSKGVATVTATMAGGYAQQCIVRSNVGAAAAPDSASPAPSASPTPSASPSGGTLSFNVSGGNDFTLTGVGDSWPLKVNNAVGTPTWSVKDTSIATVDQSGRVTAVSKGITTVTATVDGKTLSCTVRVVVK